MLKGDSESEYACAIVDAASQPLAALDEGLRVAFVNDAFVSCFGRQRDEVLGRSLPDLGGGAWCSAELRQRLREVLSGQADVHDFRLDHMAGVDSEGVFMLNARRFVRAGQPGILLALSDVTETERLRDALEARVEFAEAIVDSVREALLVLDHELRVVSANQVFYDLFRVDPQATEGRLLYELGGGQWNVPALRKLIEDILPFATAFDDYEMTTSFNGLGERTMLLAGRRLDHVDQIVFAIRDVTEQYAQQELGRKIQSCEHLLLALNDTLRTGTEPCAIMAAAGELLGRYLGVAACAFAEIEAGCVFITLDRGWCESGCAMEDAGAWCKRLGEAVMSDLEQGRTVVIGDAASDARIAPITAAPEMSLEAGSLLVVPLVREGCLQAALFICGSRPRVWTSADVAISEEVTLRVWATVCRLRAVARLRDSEERLRLAQDVAGIGTWDLDLTTGHAQWSDMLYELLGIEPGQPASTELFFEHVHPEDKCRIDERFREAVATGTLFNEEFRIIDRAGSVRIIIGRGKVVHSSQGRPVRMIGVNHDVTPYREAQQALIEGAARLERAQRASGVGVWEWRPKTGDMFWTSEARRQFEVCNDVKPTYHVWQSRLHPDDREAAAEKAALALEGSGYEDVYRVVRGDGSIRWLRASGELERDAAGEPLIMRGVLVDITEQKLHEEHIQLLMREMSHRSKNMLALVQAIARQTAARGQGDFIDRFERRLQGLAASQHLLIRSQWTGTDLGELVRAQLAHFTDTAGERIEIVGPDVIAAASAAQTIGMAIHELATNAAKYGALSNEHGSVRIAWRRESRPGREATFEMSWSEHGGPSVKAPDKAGFGSVVIKDMLEYSLGAEVDIAYADTGVTWRMRCPLARVRASLADERAPPDEASIVRTDVSPPAEKLNPERPKVLVVEDETLLAFEIAGLLAGAGFEVIGPATTLAEAAETIKAGACDAAVLDVHLGSDTSGPIAAELMARSVPVVAITSYSREHLPEVFENARVLSKPVRLEKLLMELRESLKARGIA